LVGAAQGKHQDQFHLPLVVTGPKVTPKKPDPCEKALNGPFQRTSLPDMASVRPNPRSPENRHDSHAGLDIGRSMR